MNPSHPCQIETFKWSHLDECIHLYVRVFSAEPWHESWERDSARERLLDVVERKSFCGVVAIEQASIEIIGFAMGAWYPWCIGKKYQLIELAVHPEFRRRGVALAMLARLKFHLHSVGVTAMEVHTKRSNPSAMLYAAAGFTRRDDVAHFTYAIPPTIES